MLLSIPLENGGNVVLLTLPYQIIILTYHGTNVHGQCNKYCEKNWRENTDYTIVGII